MASDRAKVIEKSPHVSILSAPNAFAKLSAKEQLYAHYLARAAWCGSRIILRQVSLESIPIFDFILELYRVCDGNWEALALRAGVPMKELRRFLDYAAVFLGNIGNYLGHGDQKFIPKVTQSFLEKLSSVSNKAGDLYDEMRHEILSFYPPGLGYPSCSAHSSYYLGHEDMTKSEIAEVSRIMEVHSIYPENTRVEKTISDYNIAIYDILQASCKFEEEPRVLENSSFGLIQIKMGDHSVDLHRIVDHLASAEKSTANSIQGLYLSKLQTSFVHGDIEAYKESQKIWVKDLQPAVESIIGFVEPYRDPFGIRAEFEGLVAVVDREETKKLTDLAENSAKYIRRLPWAMNATENDGKGPFEKNLFESPDFTSLHTVAYASSIIFPGINLPNYNDIRQEVGFKNVMITNSMEDKSPLTDHMATFLDPSEADTFKKHRAPTFYLWVVFHELLGHGTGKLLMEDEAGNFNFDRQNPPHNPLTGRPIESWYRPGQTWTGLFGDIATTVDECRAEIVGAYLMSDMELLGMFGYTEESKITGRDMEYNMYLQLGLSGLRALENYMAKDRKWGQAHSRAHFAIFRTLLSAGSVDSPFLTIQSSPLTVRIDRSKIATVGRPALAQLLLRLHLYRCTADAAVCRKFYENITEVSGQFLEWREIMLARQPAMQVFVQPNTFLDENGRVSLRDYEANVEGMIKSWAERWDDEC